MLPIIQQKNESLRHFLRDAGIEGEKEMISGVIIAVAALSLGVGNMVDDCAEEGVLFSGGGGEVIGAEHGADLGEDGEDGVGARGSVQGGEGGFYFVDSGVKVGAAIPEGGHVINALLQQIEQAGGLLLECGELILQLDAGGG